MPQNPTAAALSKACAILEDNAEALDDGSMTDSQWFEMLAELRFASRRFETTENTSAIAA